jgi:hypothetical protein
MAERYYAWELQQQRAAAEKAATRRLGRRLGRALRGTGYNERALRTVSPEQRGEAIITTPAHGSKRPPRGRGTGDLAPCVQAAQLPAPCGSCEVGLRL